MFLFETLDRIHALYRGNVGEASQMLEDLIVYLRAALPHLRESTSTVDKEATLVRSWLDIVGRSAPDWQFEFKLAEAVRDAPAAGAGAAAAGAARGGRGRLGRPAAAA